MNHLSQTSGHGMVRCMTFVDGSWLYHNQEALVKAFGAPYKIDFSKINAVALCRLRQHLATTLGTEAPALDLVRTYYFASIPENVHPDDALRLEDQKKFYTMLREVLGFELFLHRIDFRGHHLAMQDRLAKEGENFFLPKERTVDVAMATSILYYAAIDAYDIAIAVLGDADYQPALKRVRDLGKRIFLLTIEGSAAYDYLFPNADVSFSDFPPARFQDHLTDLRLTRQERERQVFSYFCARPGCGKEFYSTYRAKPGQNMYCDEHRIYRDRESGMDSNNHSVPAMSATPNPPLADEMSSAVENSNLPDQP